MNKTPYTNEFFSGIQGGSRRSAQIVAPIVIELIQPKSIVDVGCGDGTWLSVFRELGVSDVFGVDGDYVDTHSLQIPQTQFKAADLSSPLKLARTFDLAMSLEVAEHLPPESAASFVKSLVELSPVVLFSAAIPLQGGTQHLNEQWPEYWAVLFKKHNYVLIDCLREKIWGNEEVEWHYAQNAMIFADQKHIDRWQNLRRACETANLHGLALVHPRRFSQPFRCGVRDAFRLLSQATLNAARKLIPILPGDRY